MPSLSSGHFGREAWENSICFSLWLHWKVGIWKPNSGWEDYVSLFFFLNETPLSFLPFFQCLTRSLRTMFRCFDAGLGHGYIVWPDLVFVRRLLLCVCLCRHGIVVCTSWTDWYLALQATRILEHKIGIGPSSLPWLEFLSCTTSV